MYTRKENLIFGFHGCDLSVCNALVSGRKKTLNYSENPYDWLGKGMYFWENDPKRAFEWAVSVKNHSQNKKQKIKTPAVLGAVICLGNCLDFLEQENLKKLKDFYKSIRKMPLPKNKGGQDLYQRELDCFLINSLVAKQREEDESNAYDSVRGVFFEGKRLYPNAGFKEKDHIQIAVINPNCIKGFFKVRDEDDNFNSV